MTSSFALAPKQSQPDAISGSWTWTSRSMVDAGSIHVREGTFLRVGHHGAGR
uniref:Uncharacterized protein n=1 Tax=Hyaloperonospora arabidopsidis (strain Emoy2) TaxID=559515 RepID=M4C4P9_HYAAE